MCSYTKEGPCWAFSWCSQAGDENRKAVDHWPRTRSFTSLSSWILQHWVLGGPSIRRGCRRRWGTASQHRIPARKPCRQVPRPQPLGASRDCHTAEPAGPHFPQPGTPSSPLGASQPILVSTLQTQPSLPRSLRGPAASPAPGASCCGSTAVPGGSTAVPGGCTASTKRD